MLSEQKFRDLVDTTNSSISFNDNDIKKLEFLYKHYRISSTTSLSRSRIINHLSNQIKRYLIPGQSKAIYLWRLRDQVIIRYILDDQPLQPYLSILNMILEVIKMHDHLPLESEEEWRLAIRNVKDYYAICGESNGLDIEYFKKLFLRQFSVASSAKVLRNYGYELEVIDGKICIEESEQEEIARSIECDIKLIGGLESARRLFSLIQKWYDPEQERYHLVRRLKPYNNENTQPEKPIGYLLNLCVKHLEESPILSPNPEENWERMVKLATSFTSVLDVQPYKSFQLDFKTLDNLSEFLQEIAVYDSIFCLNQLRPSDVPRILRGLFSLINVDDINKIQVQLGWIPEQAILVAEAILNIDVDKLSPIIFTKEQVKDKLPDLDTTVIENILDIYCHSHNQANSEYKIPTDFRDEKYTFFKKPLLKLDRGEYVLMDRSWCSPAFYEALVYKLNEIKIPHNIHHKMGDYLERFVKEQLQTLKIKYSYGHYSVDSRSKYKKSREKGECDIIIESDDTIIFIEIKKKSLRNNAKGGCDATIFADLAGSLLDTQIQLGWHEIIIRSEGYLELTPNKEPNNKYRLELNGRSIERVTLTLLDFGGFQDRNLLYQFLQLMLSTSSIDAPDSANAKEVIDKSKINKTLPIFQYSSVKAQTVVN